MTLRRLALLAALPLLLAACDGGGDPVQQALLETSSKNQSATVVEGAVSGPEDHSAHDDGTPGAGAGAGDQAFAASEAEMHRLMSAASGATVDEAYVAKMIAHHLGAIAMAEVALGESRDPEVRRMAEGVVAAQTREIAEMRAWRPAATD
ncbi:DUF305 domain-containing protein [Brevundimonas sp. AJA228-03]|uniref:DUF305 domain-containing protein n=1 Tax=Brevundimonas sp. AJA228-03 TaxID=2752515 RepID=UPI001AE08964|nr:DUF305 domain-containing protein [Brevundimonas sp. AJA228-03]QTN19132.1 DUF305 domain-containing protein [Brevundimonas sp. AJA228-03]